jgi:hypothetical protein
LSFFDNKKFEGYWFNTGTLTFLIEQIKKKDDIELLSEARVVSSVTLRGNSDYANVNSVALLFQTGYLTIKKEEIVEEELQYTIDFPNYEVKSAFLENLLEAYTGKDINEVQTLRAKLLKVMRSKDSVGLVGKEAYYHSLFLMLAKATGIEVNSEVLTDKGRIDIVLKHKDFVVVIEIKYAKENNKVEEMVEEAMKQIRKNKYYEKYASNNPIG